VKIFDPVSLLADTPMWIAARRLCRRRISRGSAATPCRRSSPQGATRAPLSPAHPLNRLPQGSATNLPGAHLRFFFNGAQKAVVVELELPFLWTPALGIKCAIFRLNPLKALSGFRDGPSNGEIIRLAFDYKPVSPGWEYEVFILWLNH
jgi:hypothetical protein